MEFAIFIRKTAGNHRRLKTACLAVLAVEQVEAEELLTSIRRCLDMLKVEHKIMTCSLLVITIQPETNATSFRVLHFFFLRFLLDADALRLQVCSALVRSSLTEA